MIRGQPDQDALARLLRRAPVALFLYDLEHRRNAMFSDVAAHMLGFERIEDMPVDGMPMVHPEDRARVEAHLESMRRAANGFVGRVEYRMRRRDGSYLWVQNDDAPFERDGTGRVTTLLCAALDITARKEAEAAPGLTASGSGLSAFDYRPELDAVLASEGYFRLLGLPQPTDSLHGRAAFLASVHPEDREGVQAAMALVGQTGAYRAEYRIVRPDGQIRWVQAQGARLDPSGRLLGTLADITQARQHALESAGVAGFWRSVLDGLGAVVAVLSPQGDVIEINAAALALMGVDRAEALWSLFQDFPCWRDTVEDRAKAVDAVTRAAQGEVARFETGLSFEAGPCFDVTVAPLRGQSGAVEHLVAVGIDITPRRSLEARLRRNLAELQSIYDNAPIGLCVIDQDMRWVRINERLAEINGLPAERHVGRSVAELLPDLAGATEIIRKVLNEGAPLEGVLIEGETPARPGEKRVWRESFLPLRSSGEGPADAVSIVCEEITEQRRAEQRQALLLRELSHRVKNTLALVQAIVRQTTRDMRSVDEFEAVISGRLRALSGAHDLVFESDWRGASIVDLLSRALGPHVAFDRFDLELDDVFVPPGMAQNLALAIHELVTNAAKYGALSAAGGRVRLSARRDHGVLALRWLEQGGPVVAQPTVTGFGATLLSRVLAFEHQGEITMDWDPAGLAVSIRLPLSEIA